MADTSRELLEMILRDCEAAGDKPWYPSEYAQAAGVDRARIDTCLDELRLGGLVRLTEWVGGKGQGYALTDEGREVLHNPRLLGNVRHKGVPARSAAAPAPGARGPAPDLDWDRGKVLHEALSKSSPPTITMLLIALNLLNFAAGYALALQQGIGNEYLGGQANRGTFAIYDAIGALAGRNSVLQGDWWRLVTCCFVHFGGIHLALNMWVLYSFGSIMERVWGKVRFLLIYFVSGVAGSTAAVHFTPGVTMAGASGAICGLLGALLAWVWLNREYLKRSSDILRNVMANVVLMVVISFIPGVSAPGHFGGGAAGLALAVPLNFNRFGRGKQRWLGLAGAVVVTAVVLGAAYRETVPAEIEHARSQYQWLIVEADQLGDRTKTTTVDPFLNELTKNGKVFVEKMRDTFEALDKVQHRLAEIHADLAKPHNYHDDRINAAIEMGQELVDTWEKYFKAVKAQVNDQGELIATEAGKENSLLRAIDDLERNLRDSVLFSSVSKKKAKP